MMNLKEKLDIEYSGEPCVHLYHEGIFYVAYNHSAIRFVRLFEPDTKILKHVRKDGTWYLRIGIVQSSAKLDNFFVKDTNGYFKNELTIPCDSIETNLDDCMPYKIVSRSSTSNSDRDCDANFISLSIQTVIDDIRSLNLGTLTPVQAMIKIDEWQHKLMD